MSPTIIDILLLLGTIVVAVMLTTRAIRRDRQAKRDREDELRKFDQRWHAAMERMRAERAADHYDQDRS